jgi:hypothetical protein
MKRHLEYEVLEEGLLVDFENDSSARYQVVLQPQEAQTGDGVIITLNRNGCLALARLFAQLSDKGGHVHIGYTDDEPQGPGVRIVVDDGAMGA